MSIPTTVKFQIAVSSKDESGLDTEKIYTLTLSLLVEGAGNEGEIRVKQIAAVTPQPLGIVPPPEDPPSPAPQPQGIVPPPEDPPTTSTAEPGIAQPVGIVPPPEDPPNTSAVDTEKAA